MRKRCVYCGTEYNREDRCPVCGSSTYDNGSEESVDSRQRKIDENILRRDEDEKKSRRAGIWFLVIILVLLVLLGIYVFQNYSIRVLLKDGPEAALEAKEQEKASQTVMMDSWNKARELMSGSNYEQALVELNKIDSGCTCYKEAQQLKVEASVSYKAATLSMTETYIKDGKYREALILIQDAEKLVPNDTDLQTNKSSICTALSQSCANDARNYVAAGQYEEAIKTLTDTENSCGQSSEISALITVYIADYTNYIFDKANQVLATEGYAAACAVVDGAYSILKDNSDYIARRDAYTGSKTVPLSNLTPILGGLDRITGRNYDVNGVEHADALSCDSDKSATYRLDGKYSRLTGSCYKSLDSQDQWVQGFVNIYGDGQLLFESGLLEIGTEPVPFDLDINGIDILKIDIQCGYYCTSGEYQIGEALLYGTNIPTGNPTATPSPLPTAASASESVTLTNLNAGNEFYLGKYEQDNNLSNGQENIVWQVLKVENGRALAISKYGLDMKLFNDTYAAVTWETCSLRKWLNGEFYQNAFSDSEKSVILETTMSNPSSSTFGTAGGNSTTDKVFLLTEAEASTYFSNKTARLCYPTEYAVARTAFVSKVGASWWWLRSPGMDSLHFSFIGGSGDFEPEGWEVTYPNGVVRPVVWIKTQ